jgi:hypothetical protein
LPAARARRTTERKQSRLLGIQDRCREARVQAQNEMIDIEHLSDDELRGSRTSIRRCAKNAITEAPVARRALTSKLNQTEADRLKHRPADKFALKSYFPEPSTIEQ